MTCTDYTAVCNDIYTNSNETDVYFIADIERFWIWAGHNLFGGHGDELIQPCSELKSEKAREAVGVCKDELGVYLLVGKVLDSVGAGLDKKSEGDAKGDDATNREKGLLLVLEIKYSNTVNLNLFLGDNVVRYRISMFKTEVEKY
eukprot:CAMPEP_0170653680 /NCGR_PEP_ID=MMETSP0224-20130122/47531_1 /TAXON_ID=285029 /ORGANISM="Togula jolla, Strain CCCM 725" /LENGTH=144 /DNA_ID=CAMNT_0010985557 /DNA_START=18 /DNA_END=449 /DNA_ORIENTATION=-